jgi:hypothetical protein
MKGTLECTLFECGHLGVGGDSDFDNTAGERDPA